MLLPSFFLIVVRFLISVVICNTAYLFLVSCKRNTSCSELYELENDTLSSVTLYLLPDTSASSIAQLPEIGIFEYILRL